MKFTLVCSLVCGGLRWHDQSFRRGFGEKRFPGTLQMSSTRISLHYVGSG